VECAECVTCHETNSAFYSMVTPYVSECLSMIIADFNVVGHLLRICQILKRKGKIKGQ